MLKLLSWPRLQQQQTLTPNLPSLQFSSIPLNQSNLGPPIYDIHDPPFFFMPKTLNHNQNLPPPKTLDSSKIPNIPIQSGLHFDFRYSYSETNPSVKLIGFREPPRIFPFSPGRLDRKWIGTSTPVKGSVDMETVLEERNFVLGEPHTEEEIDELMEKYRHNDCARQINLGFGALRTYLIQGRADHNLAGEENPWPRNLLIVESLTPWPHQRYC